MIFMVPADHVTEAGAAQGATIEEAFPMALDPAFRWPAGFYGGAG